MQAPQDPPLPGTHVIALEKNRCVKRVGAMTVLRTSGTRWVAQNNEDPAERYARSGPSLFCTRPHLQQP